MKKLYHLNNPKFPHRNKSLKNLRAEKWRPAPGLKDYYEVSNYGRIKSLAREIRYRNGKVIHTKDKIMMAGASPSPNSFKKDYTYQLAVTCRKGRKKYYFSIARLVYHLFVEPIDLGDQSIQIIQKDFNGLNCYYKNLEKADRTIKLKRTFENKRNFSSFGWIDMKSVVHRNIEKKFKPVTQYSKAGWRIRIYKSAKMASEMTGIARSNICAVVNGYWQTAGGFAWKKGKGPKKVNIKEYFDREKISFKKKRGMKNQVDTSKREK